MASTPFRRALYERIKARGGWSWLLDEVASGRMLTDIAKELECSRSFLSRLLTRRSHPKLHEAYLAAKREAAGAMAEKGLADLTSATDRDSIQKAKETANYRKWLAGVYDREQFGPVVAGPAVVINAGQLHLAALQAARPITQIPSSGTARPALPPAPSTSDPIPEAQVEVLS